MLPHPRKMAALAYDRQTIGLLGWLCEDEEEARLLRVDQILTVSRHLAPVIEETRDVESLNRRIAARVRASDLKLAALLVPLVMIERCPCDHQVPADHLALEKCSTN